MGPRFRPCKPGSGNFMSRAQPLSPPDPSVTAALVLGDGAVYWGRGFGATGATVGEVCFNTAMTGYQEVMTDPSYAAQIVTFTTPHIGNVGANAEDMEADAPAARGCVLREAVSAPSNWRAEEAFDAWAARMGLVAIAGVDTRRLTRRIRLSGAPNGIVAHDPQGRFDLPALYEQARAWPGLAGMELARSVTTERAYEWTATTWSRETGYGDLENPRAHVVAVDYGIKRAILRRLAEAGARVTVVPADTSARAILDYRPDGIFLSNGPGDPAATADYAVPVLKELLAADIPIFGICLGHQLLALALGGQTDKMHQGHRGANHPVQDLATGKVAITAMNHGFTVADAGFASNDVAVTQKSLFDGSVCALQARGGRVFSVQQHPEASPGPQDSAGLFKTFVDGVAHA